MASILSPFVGAKADNSYGLPTEIPQGNILHCFSWPLRDIIDELPNIAAAGFGSIQISPLQRPDIDRGWTWYTIYLPYDYHVYDSPGMGTKEDLRELCSKAEAYGIKIVVDVVINHVNRTEPYYNPWFRGGKSDDNWNSNQDYRYRYWGWGSNEQYKITNWSERYFITHNCLGDYVELNTENPEVIARAKAYMEELKSYGVKGIRFDAAKHIELPSELDRTAKTQGVWPEVTSVQGLWYYGEIVGQCADGKDGDAHISDYSKYLWVPDDTYSKAAARDNGGIHTAHAGSKDEPTQGKLIYWSESHDDYSNDEWSELLPQSIIDRGYCGLACRNTQAALYYSRPRARGKENIKIEKGSTAFMSKHIVEVNKFRNAMRDRKDWFTHENGVVSVTRQGGGAVIIAKEGITNVSIANGGENGIGYCPADTYYDRVSGNKFEVTTTRITGIVGPTGVAVLYKDAAELTAPETVTITGNELFNVAYAGNFSNGNNFIHYWNSTTKQGTTWPGVQMKRAKGSDGKYYWCYNVPTGYDMVIFNNGTGYDAMQTSDLPVERNFVMDNGGATIVPVKFERGSFDPEPAKNPAKTITIEGDYNIAYRGDYNKIYYWKDGLEGTKPWPGVEMIKVTADDGKEYWCAKVEAGTTHVIFNNIVVSNNNSVGEQTGDLAYSSSKLMCEAGATNVSVRFINNGEEPEPDPTEPTEPGLLPDIVEYPSMTGTYCYFVNNINWSEIKIYTWDSSGNEASGGYPGTNICDDSHRITGNIYLWKNTSKVNPNNVIFSDVYGTKAGGGNLEFINGAVYDNNGGPKTDTETELSNAYPDKLYIIGNIDGHEWDPSYGGCYLNKISSKGVYLATGVVLKNKDNSNPNSYFNLATKVGPSINGDQWASANDGHRYGAPSGNLEIKINSSAKITPYPRYINASDCKSWQIENGTYDIIVDLYNRTVTVLQPQTTVPTMEAQQLVQVQTTADNSITRYNYLTYPPVNGKAKGVTVNGETITVADVNVTDDIYLDSQNVLFTENALVTTSYDTSDSSIDPRTASIGTLQNDGKFRGIVAISDLHTNSLPSKVNYYYNVATPYDVNKTHNVPVPMQSLAGSATVKLAVPEPKLIHSSLSVMKSDDTRKFTYEGLKFDAYYHTATQVVEIEEPNATEGLKSLAGDLFAVKAGNNFMDDTTYEGEALSPEHFLTGEFVGNQVDLTTYNQSVLTAKRWEASSADNAVSQLTMTYHAPTINRCEVVSKSGTYETVEGDTELHFIEQYEVEVDVTTTLNAITTIDGTENKTTLDLIHKEDGDFYLVELFQNNGAESVASFIIEGAAGHKTHCFKLDLGTSFNGFRWFWNKPTVRVSTLYPFATPVAAESSAPKENAKRRAQGTAYTASIIETHAAEGDVAVTASLSGIDSISFDSFSEGVRYYNLQGISIERPDAPGIYIVRHANGLTEKIVIR